MGCLSSKADINDTHPNIFVVYNIDDASNEISEGHLEITDTDVILYQKGKGHVYWPLRSLRRYGAEGDIFSFESGRKCKTGAGIYAFKCARAEKLLSKLQEKVRCNAAPSFNPGRGDDAVASEPPPLPGSHAAEAPVMLQSGGQFSQLGGEQQAMPEYANVVRNGKSITLEQAADGYMVPFTPVNMTFTNNLFADPNGREYENVGIVDGRLPTAAGKTNSSIKDPRAPVLPPKLSNISKDKTVLRDAEPASSTDADAGESSPHINYIEVEHTTNVPSSPGLEGLTLKNPPFQSSGKGEKHHVPPILSSSGEYTTIDIDRTKALSNTAKQQTHRGLNANGTDSPEGVRKTRHNSTLSELTSGFSLVGKRNSVISE